MLAGQAQPERGQIDGTLSGLRFVRNRMGQYLDPVDFIQPAEGRSGTEKRDGDAGGGCVMGWVWKTVPEPGVASLPPRGQAWEMTRFRSYETGLAGHTVGETFDRAAGFLKLAAARRPVVVTVPGAGGSRPAARSPRRRTTGGDAVHPFHPEDYLRRIPEERVGAMSESLGYQGFGAATSDAGLGAAGDATKRDLSGVADLLLPGHPERVPVLPADLLQTELTAC